MTGHELLPIGNCAELAGPRAFPERDPEGTMLLVVRSGAGPEGPTS